MCSNLAFSTQHCKPSSGRYQECPWTLLDVAQTLNPTSPHPTPQIKNKENNCYQWFFVAGTIWVGCTSALAPYPYLFSNQGGGPILPNKDLGTEALPVLDPQLVCLPAGILAWLKRAWKFLNLFYLATFVWIISCFQTRVPQSMRLLLQFLKQEVRTD